MSTGISVRHSRACATQADKSAKCTCRPSFRAEVFDKRNGKKLRKTFGNLAEAKGWRHDAASALRKGTLRAPTKTTLREAAEEWLDKCESGEILSRKKVAYKPSTLRGYRADLRDYLYDDLGALKLSDVTADDLQALIDRLVGSGLSGQRVRNIIVPMQALYRRNRRQVPVDPTRDLDLPAPGVSREWTRPASDVAELLAAASDEDRAIWACAAYAGLRLGELQALQVNHVGEHGIDVEYGWDPKEGRVTPKSQAGIRRVPVPEILRGLLKTHLERIGRRGDELIFGRTTTAPFTQTNIQRRADRAWKSAELERTSFHPLRHFYKSALDHAGISESRADRYAGHSDGRVANSYRHLLEGQLAADAQQLNEYLFGTSSGKVVPLSSAGQLWASAGQKQAV
jgi:integrase